jgi:transposase
MERYIGLDAHASSCTLGVMMPSGKRVGSHVVETNARCLIEAVRQNPQPRHVCLEEGTLSEWLYEVLSPHAQQVVVAAVSESRGPKDDRRDAFGLAEGLRLSAIKRTVYKERGGFGALGYHAKGYRWIRSDGVRVKTRLRALCRSRGVPVAGCGVYTASKRGEYLGRLPKLAQPLAELLHEQMDALDGLKREAKKAMLAEAKKHPEYRLVRSCPGLGPVRAAELLPIVVTPYRFQNKRGFWSYCGLGVVMRSSSDWVRTQSGEWMKAEVKRTRGLNRNLGHTLKAIFKGAATTVIGRAEDDPIYRHDLGLLDGGTKPNLAKLTLARQIASIVLAVWRTKEVYDPKRLEEASKKS